METKKITFEEVKELVSEATEEEFQSEEGDVEIIKVKRDS